MITIKRFMKLNPSVKTEEHAKKLLKQIKTATGFSLDDVIKQARSWKIGTVGIGKDTQIKKGKQNE
jgi:hypothetical protein